MEQTSYFLTIIISYHEDRCLVCAENRENLTFSGYFVLSLDGRRAVTVGVVIPPLSPEKQLKILSTA